MTRRYLPSPVSPCRQLGLIPGANQARTAHGINGPRITPISDQTAISSLHDTSCDDSLRLDPAFLSTSGRTPNRRYTARRYRWAGLSLRMHP
jgi:hypothetical protein